MKYDNRDNRSESSFSMCCVCLCLHYYSVDVAYHSGKKIYVNSIFHLRKRLYSDFLNSNKNKKLKMMCFLVLNIAKLR